MPTAEASSAHIAAPTLPAAGPGLDELRAHDPELADVLLGEARRQASCLQLIAGENFTSPAVLTALGSPLANKYAEGYPGARHHAGCEWWTWPSSWPWKGPHGCSAPHANVQPYSGSSAVLAAYAALLRPGDTVLALGAAPRRPLTHGSQRTSPGAGSTSPVRGDAGGRASSTTSRCGRWPAATGPRRSSAGPSPTPAPRLRRLPRDSRRVGAYLIADAAHTSGWSPGERRPAPCRTPTSSAPPRTRCCAGRAAG